MNQLDDIYKYIAPKLTTSIIAKNLIYHPSLTSTMDAGRDLALANCPQGTVVLAGEQTAGRGRLKRTWISPRGNVAFSVILSPTFEQLPYMIMISSLAVVRGIGSTTGVKAGIKWPNDVQINGRKVCGILIENYIRNHTVQSNIGIGVNIEKYPEDLPETAVKATCLENEAGHPVPRADFLAAVFNEMDKLYALLQTGPDAVFNDWRASLVTLGKQVKVGSGDETFNAMALDVNRDGSLVIRREDGSMSVVVAGDVSIR